MAVTNIVTVMDFHDGAKHLVPVVREAFTTNLDFQRAASPLGETVREEALRVSDELHRLTKPVVLREEVVFDAPK